MSEEILKALMQLFAIIAKQDDGSTEKQREFVKSFLESQLNQQKVKEYLSDYDEKSGGAEGEPRDGAGKLTSVKDSVRTLAICRKINKTLTQKQKTVVLLRLFEMLMSEQLFTEQRMGIIRTVATVFNIYPEELELINSFIQCQSPEEIHSKEILIIGNNENSSSFNYIQSTGLDKYIFILRIKSSDLYFVKYSGSSELSINGLLFNIRKIYLFPQGSTLRLPKGTVYYNDVVSRYLSSESTGRLSFRAENLCYTFPNGTKGLNNINIAEEFGLIGIMGASGSGKTTLLNVLSGIESPSEGTVTLNGVDIHKDSDKAKSMIGYIAQDDFLMEDLTVYENLFFNAKLCFSNLENDAIREKVDKTLTDLGLFEIRDIKVGTPLNKKISGGQRKRLNIALELIREPSVLFVDEPTSGLSSRDSENVMDLLKELSLQMKLIFVVIHQPSSDIFKMFDRLYIMDTGGFPIYYGNPIEALMYFKKVTQQINSEVGECHACGNVNPELLFNIIESKEVDDFGRFTRQRIKNPADWNELYIENFKPRQVEEVTTIPQRSFQIPDRIKQMGIFIKRDVFSKVSNLQYMLISLLEAPLMALFLTAIIKYTNDRKTGYVFSQNENLPPYIFMSIVIALFIGLSVSAEEIFRDRKILKRERFLNLSRSSYLLSKIAILFTLSAVQMLIFVILGNSILGIKGLSAGYWIVLFSSACFANVLGLNISSAFNSAVTIYILIPLLIIPQMALGGAMFNFDKINKAFGGGKGNAPVIADFMASRWSYEALAVTQFRNNRYEKLFYGIDQVESHANYRQVFLIPELNKIVNESETLLKQDDGQSKENLRSNLALLRKEFGYEMTLLKDLQGIDLNLLKEENFNVNAAAESRSFLKRLEEKYIAVFNAANAKKDNMISNMEKLLGGADKYQAYHDRYYNDFLSEIVRKVSEKKKIIRENDALIQNYEPVYLYPSGNQAFSFRAHFFSPVKFIAGRQVDTLWFNLVVIWGMSALLYLALYYDLLRKGLDTMGNFFTAKNSKM
ncbi:MAG TPA: ATP-binding cassette domain-containing protein [Bacteroidales bacterium]|nr:ATP-binding cassette domain-containing protein [Bacteroidales bacterium]